MEDIGNRHPTLVWGRVEAGDIIQATDGLIEALALLPSKTHVRIFSDISTCRRDFWMQFEHLAKPELAVFLQMCRQGGIAVSDGWRQGTEGILDRAADGDFWKTVGDGQNGSMLVVTVKESCELTVPGTMQELTLSLRERGFCGFAMLDFQMAAQAGLAFFGLTLILKAEQPVPADAASDAADLISTCLDVVSRFHVGQSARRIMTRVDPRSKNWRRPRLPATLGNIADLFPL